MGGGSRQGQTPGPSLDEERGDPASDINSGTRLPGPSLDEERGDPASDIDSWTRLGNVHRSLGELREAIDCFERALARSERSPDAHSNLGVVYAQAGRFDEAVAHFRRAVQLEPEGHLLHSNAAYALLSAGELAEGWREWEWGAVRGGPRGEERRLQVPRWTPDRGFGRVCCYREQGVGDELLFASCYPDLITSAADVVIECDARLESLFTRSFPAAAVRAQTYDPLLGETRSDFDYAIPAGSLPRWFRASLDAFPARRAFLAADPERVATWRARLAELAPGPHVGISWRSRLMTAERRLEYTRLADWGPLFSLAGVSWINLQYDGCDPELRAAERRFGVTVHHLRVDLTNDFEEMAALTAALDLVIAPRNAVAMLAGALGVPTVMTGNRWSWSDLGTGTSPWFPSAQLVCRNPGEPWNGVLATAAATVGALADGERVRAPMLVGN